MSKKVHVPLTPNCPGNHPGMRNVPAGELLDRELLDRDFEMFSRAWLYRAERAAKREDWFSGLIYLWVTFNGWLSIVVTDRRFSERDSYLWQACGVDPQFCASFDSLIQKDEEFRELAHQFRDLWPVFKVRALVDKRVNAWGTPHVEENRTEFRARCFFAGLSNRDYAPRCYLDHQDEGYGLAETNPRRVPLDWGHTVGAIYKIRCNLFHGGKSFLYSKDQEFTRMAYEILDRVWRETGSV